MKRIMLTGSITVFILILVGLMVGFYLMGYQSPIQHLLTQDASIFDQDTDVEDIVDGIIGTITANWAIFGVITALAVAGAFFGGDSMISFISVFLPIFILLFIANFLFFPVVMDVQAVDRGIMNPELPIGIIMTLVFNVLTFLAIIEFITGRN